MKEQRSIQVNMIMNVILTTSNFVFPLITYAYIARTLTPIGTGRVAFVQAAVSYFSMFATLGIPTYAMREAAKIRTDKEELSKFVQEILIISIISTTIAYGAMWAVVAAIPRFRAEAGLFAVLSLNVLLLPVGIEWLYGALEQYTYITVRSIAFKCLSVVLIFLLIKSPDDYVVYGFLAVFSTTASNILNLANLRKCVPLHRFPHYEIKRHLKPIFVFFMAMASISIYTQVDSLMIGFIKNDYAVGIYGAANKIKGVVSSVSLAITSVLIPRMSVYFAQNKDADYLNLQAKSLRVMLIIVLPLSTFILVNPQDVILFLCGEEYLSAQPTLVILAVCTYALLLTNLFGNQILVSKGDEKRYSQSVFIGLWINLLLNSLLIPRYGAPGAAFATLMTECFNVFWMGQGCVREIQYLQEHMQLGKYLVALLFALCVMQSTTPFLSGWHLIFRLTAKTCALFGSYYLYLLVCKEAMIWEVLTKLKARLSTRRGLE